MKAVLYAVQGEYCLGKEGDIRVGRTCGTRALGWCQLRKSVLRMKRMSQSAQKSRSLQLRASDEAERGAEDRPRAPAGLDIASPRRAYTNHLLTRSSGFGRVSLRSESWASTGRRTLKGRRRGVYGRARVFIHDDTFRNH